MLRQLIFKLHVLEQAAGDHAVKYTRALKDVARMLNCDMDDQELAF